MKHLLSLAFYVLLTACGSAEQESAQKPQERAPLVLVAQPELRDIDDVLTALGSVESINDPTVSAETSGQAMQIAVREGDTVEPGQLLAALDSTLHAIESAKAVDYPLTLPRLTLIPSVLENSPACRPSRFLHR